MNLMTTAEQVRSQIDEMKPGLVFLASDLNTFNQSRKATNKAVAYYCDSENSTLGNPGTISKVAAGLYYKEETGLLGRLPPSFSAIMRALIYTDNKQVGYIVGHQLFNQRGLSTQVPATITLVTSKNTPISVDVSGIKIAIQRKKQAINEQDIGRFELAYILNNVHKIQALEGSELATSLSGYFSTLLKDHQQFKQLYQHLVYKKTKALLGALLEQHQQSSDHDFSQILDTIKQDMSIRSQYKLGHLSRYIDNRQAWNITF
jgi:hypothetical protein